MWHYVFVTITCDLSHIILFYTLYSCVVISQIVTYLVYNKLKYRFKVLISRVKQATKDVVKSEI